MGNIDQTLGRLLLRIWATMAFLGGLAGILFGVFLVAKGHLPGVLGLLLGCLLIFLGVRAWRDKATLGELLNRDFERIDAKDSRVGRRNTESILRGGEDPDE